MIEFLGLLIVSLALIIGSYTDIKVREVPDWLSFSLIAAGFGVGVIRSVVELSYVPLLSAIIGFSLAFLISALMFYTGQWGGGDAKMLMGMGAVIGITFNLSDLLASLFSDFFISFILNTIVIGAFYGLLWGLALAVINRKKLFLELKKLFSEKHIVKIRLYTTIIVSVIIVIILVLPLLEGLRLPLIVLALLMFSTVYLWIFVKAIEKVCMVKKVKPSELTEGDWIIEDIVVGKNFIAGKKDLGVSKEQILKILELSKKGKIKLVTIKTGIPFIPSFLISYIITLLSGNLFLLVIK